MKVLNEIISLKIVTKVIAFALFCCLGFSYISDIDFLKSKNSSDLEKMKEINDLKKFNDSLELIITENYIPKDEFIIEKQKVVTLLNRINKANIEIISIVKYKSDLDKLTNTLASLSKDKMKLESSYDLLKSQKDSVILLLTDAEQTKEILLETNRSLKRDIKKMAKITVSDLKANSFKQSDKGKLSTTNKAKKVNVLQISFTVEGKRIAEPHNKEYYVQIIDSKNKIVGRKKTQNFGEMTLDYSYQTPVKVKNESKVVSAELLIDNVEKGTYEVNLFDKNVLASKMTFALR